MSFYNYRNERELVNGTDRTRRNPWLVKTGHSVTQTSVDDIAIGDYTYFKQHVTLSNGVVFNYNFEDNNSTSSVVKDAVGGLLANLSDTGGAITSRQLFQGGLAGKGGFQFDQSVNPDAMVYFQGDVFPQVMRSSSKWTLSFWYISRCDYSVIDMIILSRRIPLDPCNFSIYTKNGVLVFSFETIMSAYRTIEYAIPDSGMHQYTFVCDGSSDVSHIDVDNLKLYVDGVYASSATLFEDFTGDPLPDPIDIYDLYIGTGGDVGYDFYLGQITLWDRCLNEEEILVNYNDGNYLIWTPSIFDYNPSSVFRHDSEYDNFASESDRGNYDEVFVNRFSSPGSTKTNGGFLDRESLSLSSYNAQPWRNLEERAELDSLEDIETQVFTIPPDDAGVSWLSSTALP